MIKLIAGRKGTGKTKRLIDMVNESVKNCDGNIVFIDDDRRHIFDLHYNIRFIDTADFEISNYREFVGFIYGILSSDSDISEIYVDGIHNIVDKVTIEDLVILVERLHKLALSHNLTFICAINNEVDDLPANLKELVI